MRLRVRSDGHFGPVWGHLPCGLSARTSVLRPPPGQPRVPVCTLTGLGPCKWWLELTFLIPGSLVIRRHLRGTSAVSAWCRWAMDCTEATTAHCHRLAGSMHGVGRGMQIYAIMCVQSSQFPAVLSSPLPRPVWSYSLKSVDLGRSNSLEDCSGNVSYFQRKPLWMRTREGLLTFYYANFSQPPN